MARTVFQAQLLSNLFGVTDELRQRIAEVMWEVQRRLLDCYRISEAICGEILYWKDQFGGLKDVPADFVDRPAPWIKDLRSRLESFLYSAKLAVRDSGEVLFIFFGKKFGHKLHEALSWAEENFGKDDLLVQVLRTYQPFVKQIVDLRNAVEHPGDERDLQINNFKLEQRASSLVLHEPCWALAGGPVSEIFGHLPLIVDRLLCLSEAIYIASLIKVETPISVQIVEIPEGERNPAAPVRFRAIGQMPSQLV